MTNKLRPLLIFGTRPEAIKMAPIVRRCCSLPEKIAPFVCLTGQHREMLDQVVQYFEIQPDQDLELMQPNQSLIDLTVRCLQGIDRTVTEQKPDCIVVQGDTTTVMAASIAAFYHKTPIVHVEAGLRTGNLFAPWPEEFNRRVASIVATLHCAPTQQAAENLRREGVDPKTVFVTGNTVIDSLLWSVERERKHSCDSDDKTRAAIDAHSGQMVLITGHRRENFGDGFENMCQAIKELADRFADVLFVYPVHLNPNVRKPVHRILGQSINILLVEPAAYPVFVWMMDRSTLILTDSGGVQEEAPSLKKPVLVMRETTERPEAVEAGAVELVGTDRAKIVDRVSLLLTDKDEYQRRQIDVNPYGDGQAAERIVDLMLQQNWQDGPK